MPKTIQKLFRDTKLNDRMTFRVDHGIIYRRICQVGEDERSILWIEPRDGYPNGNVRRCSSDSTARVYVIKED